MEPNIVLFFFFFFFFGASGFTRLCKGLSLLLISLHILLHLFPSAITYLALIPARTIPFAWNLITAGYLEQSFYGRKRCSSTGREVGYCTKCRGVANRCYRKCIIP